VQKFYLCHRDINKCLRGGVHDVQQTHNSGTIVRNCGSLSIVHKLVHASGAQGGLDSFSNSLAGIDIRNNLSLSLTRVSALPEQDNLRLKSRVHLSTLLLLKDKNRAEV